MSPGADEVVRVSGSWYSHYLKSIYSHSGEILGAGIGYGANLYRISGAINSRFNRIEVYCEKLQHNPDASIVKWSDFAIGFVGRIKLKSFLFNSRLTGIYSKNYSWQQDTNRFNFMGMIGVSYFY
jgi:hypothetical protein